MSTSVSRLPRSKKLSCRVRPGQRLAPGQCIDQRRLADVGAARERHLRQPGLRQLVQALGRVKEPAFGGEQQPPGFDLFRSERRTPGV
jgi:hypothetical protein